MFKKLLRKLLGVKQYELSFKEEEQNFPILFANKDITEQFEMFMKNQIIKAIRQKKFDKSLVIDEVFGDFIEYKEQTEKMIQDISELTPSQQVVEVQKKIIPTQV